MSRNSNYYEQAIALCNEVIEDRKEYIEIIKVNLSNMEDFNTSFLGKAMRQFCEEYTNGTFNTELLAEIEEMLKSPELNPYEFAIDYDKPCKGEKLLYGKKFTTSYKDFGYPDAWFMFYHWDNYDLDKDIENMRSSLKEAERDIKEAKNRLCNAEMEMNKFYDLSYPATDISDLDEVSKYAKTITITQAEGNTFNTITIIQKCMKEGIPITILYDDIDGIREQKIDVRDTDFTVNDEWDYYERPMKYDDYEMRKLDTERSIEHVSCNV